MVSFTSAEHTQSIEHSMRSIAWVCVSNQFTRLPRKKHDRQHMPPPNCYRTFAWELFWGDQPFLRNSKNPRMMAFGSCPKNKRNTQMKHHNVHNVPSHHFFGVHHFWTTPPLGPSDTSKVTRSEFFASQDMAPMPNPVAMRWVGAKRNLCSRCNLQKWRRSISNRICGQPLTTIIAPSLENISMTNHYGAGRNYPNRCSEDRRWIIRNAM